MTITEAEIERLLSEVMVARGRAYNRKGRVLAVERLPGGRIAAKVRGNAAAPYIQSITLVRDEAGTLRRIDGSCSCPVGHNCKHVAAALLALAVNERAPSPRQRPAPPQPAEPPPSLSPELRLWLAELETADRPQPAEADAYPPGVKDRLLYVVDVTDRGILRVEPMKATLRQDGDFSRTVRRYDASGLGWREPAKFVRPTDQRILHRLKLLGLDPDRYAPRTMAAVASPLPGEVLDLLLLIARTGRGRWAKAHGPVLAEAAPRQATLAWQDDESGRQRLAAIDAEARPLAVLPLEPPAFVDPATGALGRLELAAPQRLVATLLRAPEIPPEAAPVVADALGRLRSARLPAPRLIAAETRTGIAPTPVLQLSTVTARQRLGRWSGTGPPFALPVLRLAFDYAGHRVRAFPYDDPQFREADTLVTLGRDRAAEQRAHDRLRRCGTERLDRQPALAPGREAEALDQVFTSDGDLDFEMANQALAFMAEELPLLRAAGWRVEIDPSWPYRLHEGPVAIRAGIDDGDGTWFSVGLTLDAGGQRLDLAPLILSIIAALPLAADGTLAEDFDLEEFLADLTLYQRLEDGSHVPIEAVTLAPLVEAFLAAQGLLDGFHPAEAARVAALAEALDGCGVPFEGGQALLELGRRLRALGAAPMVEPPAGLKAALRPYQKTGYGWLRAVAATGFGAVLADDMGLGKTVQALALLAHLHLEQGSDRPSLLVAPTSLVGTWRREAERFVPDLKVLILHGPDRQARFGAIADHHLVVTTYPLLHRDHERLFAAAYELAILDEAQAVKNPASSAAKQIRKVEARTRLALTGTPVENNLEDLWTLFDWLIPGLLGNRKAFRGRFRQAIEKHGDAAAQALLNARIRPFILRRSKAEVATELPPKTEIVETVSLGPAQRGLYETIRLTMDQRVRRAIAERGLAGSRITILDALLKLRQVCCDPALLPDEPGRSKHQDEHGGGVLRESAKRERLLEMLEALLAEGRRVLVFSQFVKMLRLIEADVKARGWDYAWLTGETKDRETVVARFQTGETPLFLISLKAGGVGLTLTAAETVILYDPWWNPAVERQAMDRAHRIGQDRAVFVYRLVAEGSVEEAIITMQARKQAMADALFEGEASGPLGLDEDDLASLFRPLAAG